MKPTATNTNRRTGERLLDRVHHHLEEGRVGHGMHLLFTTLSDLRRDLSGPDWWQFIDQVVVSHPMMGHLHEDPMCRRSFEKPRGYPGDAELIDYIYGLTDLDGISELGKTVNAWCMGRGPIRGVRHRREWLASILDAEAARINGKARVLSVACGHLREALLSAAFHASWLDEVVALDSDAISLEVATGANTELVTPVRLSVSRLPTRAKRLGKFDLIYSAGLYDYLDDRLASALTASLFDILNPGGRLVVGNFLNDVDDCSFMEAIMGWRLIYRSREELEAVFGDIPADQRSPLRFHADPYGVFGYVECTRRP